MREGQIVPIGVVVWDVKQDILRVVPTPNTDAEEFCAMLSRHIAKMEQISTLKEPTRKIRATDTQAGQSDETGE